MTILTLPATGFENRPSTPTPDLDSYPTMKSMDMASAVCPQTDADSFHNTKNLSDQEMLAILKVCAVCTISEACLDAAMEQLVEEDWGIWGGTTRLERKKIRKHPELREKYVTRLIDIRRNRVSSIAGSPAELAEAV
jgi:hypothetical protein